ncbi:MAG: hypothetical protein NZ455_04450 [Bacteroidia bacterium]|nr:hypothetical protein [Bacteroidia bacterium]MDW8347473.1 hypothetical protein [Bacteroidia bacterium]
MKKNKKKKLLFGAVDTNWRIHSYTQYLQTIFPNELKIHSFVKYVPPKEHYHAQYTYAFQYQKLSKFNQWLISLYFFLVALWRYDIFYFIAGETLLTRKLLAWELKQYKKRGKKVVMHFVGSDIRNEHYTKYKNTHIQAYFEGKLQDMPPKQTEWQKKLCSLALQYADLILVSTPDLIEFFGNSNKVKYFPVMLDTEDIDRQIKDIVPEKYPQRDKIRVIHSPSNTSLKGTAYIDSVMERVCLRHPEVEYINTADPKYKDTSHPLCAVSRYTLLELLQKSDILIDQVVIGWYGLQSIEGVYCQNEVVVWVEPHLRSYLPADAPFYICTQGVEESIVQAIENVKNGVKKSTREYVMMYHTLVNSSFAAYLRLVLM